MTAPRPERVRDAARTRILLPIVVPTLALVTVAVIVVDVSRLFLAGDDDAALIAAIVLSLAILGGASLLVAAPRLGTPARTLIVGAALLVVAAAGLLTLGPSLHGDEGKASTGYVSPKGPPVGRLSVQAGPGLTFGGKAFTATFSAPRGIVRIDYGGASGHTLAIEGSPFDGFLLASTGAGTSGKVQLTPGDYTIYCTVPGHREAGMQGTISVS